MKLIFYFTIILLVIGLCLQCKPYNSNAENECMLQGTWMLTESNHVFDGDSSAGYTSDTMTYSFKGNEITEYIKAYNLNTTHAFAVRNYNLEIYDADSLISKFTIIKLWNDSLILGKVNYWWLYTKVKTP